MHRLINEGPARELPQQLSPKTAAFFGAPARYGRVMNYIVRSTLGAEWDFRDGMPDETVTVDAFHRHTEASERHPG
ncbi:hypothetical protein FAF44_33035 [Nonomuraea sp. MG754425]|nr:hypothetical protein [Nonomuraea sp. MG754425]